MGPNNLQDDPERGANTSSRSAVKTGTIRNERIIVLFQINTAFPQDVAFVGVVCVNTYRVARILRSASVSYTYPRL